MIDRNKLNRIKGVLSARAGAEIPKFQDGAKFAKQNEKGRIIYSVDGTTWFNDLALQQPYFGSLNGFNDVSTKDAPQYEIPGDQEITVTTAPEKAKEQIEQTEQKKAEVISDATVQQDPVVQRINKTGIDFTKPMSPNDPPKLADLATVKAAVPEKLEVPQQILDQQKSAGMKLLNDIQKQTKLDTIADNAAYIGTQVFQGIGDAFGASQATTDSTLTKTADAVYDQTAEVVKKLGPVGQVIGTAMGFAGAAGDIIQGLGSGTDQMTSTDKWMDSSFFSWNIGMLNGFGGKRSDSFAADQDILASVGSSYGGTTEDINNAASKASKKYGLFSSGARRKANRQIADARAKQNLMGDISEEATDQRLAVQSMGEQAGLAYSLMTDGGYNQKYTYAAKHGGLLEWNPEIELEWEPQVELNWELPEFKEGGSIDLVEELEWIPEFKDGGKTEESDIPETEETTQKNVIPEGALHKNKHHMEHAEGLTKKGIPVIDEDGEQQAEIEHSEIIFTLEVTKKLEEYYDIFYSEESSNKEKEQAALDAGKLLVYQILENTEDRTGLIESCKKGGSLKLKTSTEDLIEEVLEWMPTIVVIEEEIKKEKPKEDKKKSEKEQMKEAIKEVLIELLTK